MQKLKEELSEIGKKEITLREELRKIRNSNLAHEEAPMIVDTIHRDMTLLQQKKKKLEKIINGKGVKKTLGTAIVLVSVNGDKDKKMEVIITEEDLAETITVAEDIYIVSAKCPLFNAIKTAKKNDLVILKRETKGRETTTFIRVVEKSF